MKTRTLMTGSWIFVLAALLTSCSTSIDIAKRQFNGGYYVNISKKQPVASKSASTPADEASTRAEEATAAQATVQVGISAAEMREAETELVAARPEKKSRSTSGPAAVTAIPDADLSEPASSSYSDSRSVDSFQAPSMSGRPSDLILILLCIFLPFIAVGIVDDWGTRFLISILLCLLFWIPGVIYAFIVCFG